MKIKKKFCSYCGKPLSEECDCERIIAREIAEYEEERLEEYYNDPEVQLGWRNQDLIEMRRREQ